MSISAVRPAITIVLNLVRSHGVFMKKIFILFMAILPMLPDLSCCPVYATEVVTVQNFDSYVSGVLFVLSMIFGNFLWRVFIDSFEKGTV